jgi:hypothetical protein
MDDRLREMRSRVETAKAGIGTGEDVAGLQDRQRLVMDTLIGLIDYLAEQERRTG